VWEYPGVWREVESKEHGGRVYYFNKETGESVWEQPEELAWKRVKVDPSEL
jgi:outer membrane protein assembly factor BamB